MIVVMLGTGPDSFDRLIKPMDELAGENNWDVFVQLGHTSYIPGHCQYERFLERGELLDRLRQAEVVISQGGYGSIRDVLYCERPLVAVPRYPVLNESPDEQEELVRAMEADGYLVGVYDIADLEKAIEKAGELRAPPRPENQVRMLITQYLEERQR